MLLSHLPWPFYLGVVAAALGNGLWYWVKSVNQSRGYRTSWITHSGDLRHFKMIIEAEDDIEKASRYRLILKGIYTSIGLVFLSFVGTAVLLISGRI